MRAIGAAGVLLVLVCGIPLALAITVGNPLAEWDALRVGDVTAEVVLDVLACVCWVSWAQFVLALLREASALTRPVHPLDAGQITAPRQVARALLAAVLVALPVASPVQALAAPGSAIAATASPYPSTSPGPVATAGPSADAARTARAASAVTAATVASAPVQASSAQPAPQAPAGTGLYRVSTHGPGTYWELAEVHLGQGTRWKEIWDLNAGRVQADGARMRTPGLLRVGWTVLLPVPAQEAGQDAPPGAGEEADGDAPVLTYEVVEGDWLGAIAERFLGDVEQYPLIQTQTSGARLDPDHIEPGWRLLMPERARDRGPGRHAAGQAQPLASATHDPAADERHVEAQAPVPASPAPSLAPGAIARTDADIPAPTAGPSTAPTDTPPPATGAGESEGVEVGGSWITLALAAALLAAAGLVWLRRRHRHRYDLDDPGGSDRDEALDAAHVDADLRPLPATVTLLRRAVREHAAALAADPAVLPLLHDDPDPDGVGPQLHRPGRGQGAVVRQVHAVPDAGPRSGRPFGVQQHPGGPIRPAAGSVPGPALPILPAGGLGLTGPGCLAAARALLVSGLSEAGPGGGDQAVQVITTVATLREILPAAGLHVPEAGAGVGVATALSARLHVAADIDEVLVALEAQVVHRHRLVHENQLSARSTDQAPDLQLPPLLVVTGLPASALHSRLHAALRSGAGVKVRAVLLGAWPGGATVTVAATGHVRRGGQSAGPHGRLAVLDEDTAADLLGVLAEAYPPPQPPSAASGHGPDRTVATLPRVVAPPTPHPPAQIRTRAPDPEPGPPGSAPLKVRVQLLGAPTIWRPDATAESGLRQRARELLTYLSVHRRGATGSQILEALYPDATRLRASQGLSTEVSNLRRILRAAAGNRELIPVVNTGGSYHLDPHLLDIDVWRLHDHLAAAAAAVDPGASALALRQAVRAHTGTLAEGHDYDWLHVHREQQRRDGVRARLLLATHESTSPQEAAELINQGADIDPGNEDVARRAITALLGVGQDVAARARLLSLRSALAEIGVEPRAETTALLEGRVDE